MKREGKNRRLRRAGIRLGGSLAALLALVFVVLLTFVMLYLNPAFTLPVGSVGWVSERAQESVGRLTKPVKATCFMAVGHVAHKPTMRLLRGLRVASLEGAGRELEIAFVSPQRDLAAARELIAAGVSPDSLVFDDGNRRVVFSAEELFVPDNSGAEDGGMVFMGEAMCVAALERLGRSRDEKLYWLDGHGEARIDDYDPNSGYSDIAREIIHSGFSLVSLSLAEVKEVPADAAALLILSPRFEVTSEEAALIQEYLNKGGRLLYLASLNGESGLEDVLSRWGVVMTRYRAVDSRTIMGGDLVITSYGDHKITTGFKDVATLFGVSWCIETVSFGVDMAADRIRTTVLAQTSAKGWGEAAGSEAPLRYDAERDMLGPVTVAVAAERGGGTAADLGFRATRIVVIGDGLFASNGRLGRRYSANRDFTLNAVNWLTEIEAATKTSLGGDMALVSGLDRNGWMKVLLWFSGVLPGAVLVLGFVGARRYYRIR